MDWKPYKRLFLIGGIVVALLLFWAGIRYGQDRLPGIETAFVPGTDASAPSSETDPPSGAPAAPEAEAAAVTEAAPTIMVHVVGAVQEPGVYTLEQGARVRDLVELAKPSEEADLSQINLADFLEDASQIRIPKEGEKVQVVTNSSGSSGASGSSGSSGTGAGQGKSLVNINQATQKELETLPGVGPAYSARIIAYRESKGFFSKIEDLTKVSGIGPATLEKLRPYITVD
ncbi:MAG: helix-hairpin-helix domain-containing protein [Peptococcaceae bacterium]|nr:helix-hairpin-helix domain-containing protein [Peptococcaceae bacterium]